MNALSFNDFGGPEVLSYGPVARPTPGPGEVLMKNEAIGLNFADVYRRRGNYHLVGNPPFIAGYEAAGEVVAQGPGVSWPEVGHRIAVADVPLSNAEFMIVPSSHAIPIPEQLSFQLAAALPLQGLTAQYLSEDSYNIAASDVVMIHAASGGVGRLLVQMAKSRGAKVVGLTSTKTKMDVISSAGADHVVLLQNGWQDEVLRLNGGLGVDVAYDSLGRTLDDTLQAVKDCGTAVFYGMAAGDPAPVDPRLLMDRSLTLAGGDLWSYLTSAEERKQRGERLFAAVLAGKLEQRIARTFPLAEGAAAHLCLEEGQVAGKILLIP